jgi:hypothetical protein
MSRSAGISLLVLFTMFALADEKPVAPKGVTVAELQQVLAQSSGKTDAEIAQQLSTLHLIERLSTGRLAQLNTRISGEKSRQALLLLADESAFLVLPADEIGDSSSTPSAMEARRMLVQIVSYVNTALHQLPNLIATQETIAFEDRPQEDELQETGIVSYSYLPLHFVGESTATVTYRDHKEEVAKNKGKGKIGGLVTSGVFGPILTTVVADALKGKITWARWELDENGDTAVFRYSVPEGKSHYRVKFCCILNGFSHDGQADMRPFDEATAYHGEITFRPSDGSILRLSVEAELPPLGLVPKAGIVVEYKPTDIGGKDYICPAKSISILLAHVNRPQGMYSRANYGGTAKTFLNDASFNAYHRFGSEMHIIAGTAEPAH